MDIEFTQCLVSFSVKCSPVKMCPKWAPQLAPEWHNCIVGCIRCQAACPENKPFLKSVGETVEFTEQETKLLLQGTPPEELPADIVAKMKALSLMDYYSELPRNLGVLLLVNRRV